MTEKKKFIIDTTEPGKAFKHHLELPENQRIIFSAPFGTGKTYFLKEYFKEPNPTIFHLYPVNYSVNSNEDIFELIKFDILYSLLDPERKLGFETFKLNLPEKASILLNNQIGHGLMRFIEYVPKIGKPLSAITNSLQNLYDKFIDETKGFDQQKQSLTFLKELEKQKGSIYEHDLNTDLIIKLIYNIKKEHGKTILIIDDLDRIDPEHIFRLLNIFAAHFDINYQENKFGFDQIILVCDIDNVRRLFFNKYGQGIDFSGYIDKFYSRDIFYFDNSQIIADSVQKILLSIKQPNHEFHEVFKLNQKGSRDFNHLKDIITALVLNNCINLRSLLKFADKEYHIENRFIQFGDSGFQTWQIQLLLSFEFLSKLMGDSSALVIALEKIRNHFYIDMHSYGLLVAIINWKEHKFRPSDGTRNNIINNKKYSYQIKSYGIDNNIYAEPRGVVTIGEIQTPTSPDYMELLYQAVRTLVELKILR